MSKTENEGFSIGDLQIKVTLSQEYVDKVKKIAATFEEALRKISSAAQNAIDQIDVGAFVQIPFDDDSSFGEQEHESE